ncbi:hypothetical protein [Pantoea sp. BAV 3049]|uniref:hypothetical protein n=1 Tax=Pantoea sp. BAV 3049 TaxID=2654188 RepID=UPI00131E78FA|nr:hypothetical protein [Pantoea sp. BAV 3049]
MSDIELESALLKNGFNDKNIKDLQKIINRSEGRETLSTLLVDLKRRFYAGCLMLIIILMPLACKITFDISGSLTAYLIAFVFGFYCVYQIVPLVLAWKAYRFLSKRG